MEKAAEQKGRAQMKREAGDAFKGRPGKTLGVGEERLKGHGPRGRKSQDQGQKVQGHKSQDQGQKVQGHKSQDQGQKVQGRKSQDQGQRRQDQGPSPKVQSSQGQGVRLNKWLGDAGICSRREADKLIESGRVTVDGERAVMGMKVFPGQTVLCDGKEVAKKEKTVLLAVNKPRGIVCTTSRKDRATNIVEFLDFPSRIYPLGRLDKDSEGLLLMTNQGDIVNRILRGGNGHEKEYLVTVNRPITPAFLGAMSRGVPILDTVTKPCQVEKTGERAFRIILTQGLNRQIRRMCEALGYQVVTLRRIRIMNIKLGNLKTGEWRYVAPGEWEELKKLLAGSSSLPYQERQQEGTDIHG